MRKENKSIQAYRICLRAARLIKKHLPKQCKNKSVEQIALMLYPTSTNKGNRK